MPTLPHKLTPVNPVDGLTYTPAFFAALEKLLDASHLHRCARCGTADGVRGYGKNGIRRRSPARVRLALKDVSKPPNDSNNINLFCQHCRRPSPEWLTRACRPKASTLPQLF
jgi:hypothetical protein